MKVEAVSRPEVPAFEMPDRFRTDVAYFSTPSGPPGIPPLAAGEHWIRIEDSTKWLDELVVEVVSPLDAASKAEVELTAEQEAWLEWMVKHQVQHIRLVP